MKTHQIQETKQNLNYVQLRGMLYPYGKSFMIIKQSVKVTRKLVLLAREPLAPLDYQIPIADIH